PNTYSHSRTTTIHHDVTTTTTVRTHMNHGNPTMQSNADGPILPASGPRKSHMDLGFSAAKHTGNILRLLESSHGEFLYNTVDSLSTVWHAKSQSWQQQQQQQQQQSSSSAVWTAVNPIQSLQENGNQTATQSKTSVVPKPPSLCSLQFSDDRTALLKLLGHDGQYRYLQLLRVDGDAGAVSSGAAAGVMLPNDGWVLVQEVVMMTSNTPESMDASTTSWQSLQSAIRTYLDIEHGGGDKSYEKAKTLFHKDAKLLSVGIDEVDSAPTTWTAPVGSLVEIPLSAYLEGVQSQSPHSEYAKSQDAIVAIDYSTGANAAAAVVRVGNGAQTMVFEDHLLFGRNYNNNHSSEEWSILSKTFSSQAWPSS
ncbi:MAG: hypothetical protein SGILL_008939, partial [Bacillariaceae sp.]